MSRRIFAGYDPREAAGFHAFVGSLLKHSKGFSVEPLSGEQGDGTNAFGAHERFSVPHKCEFRGWGLYVDGSDMLVRGDIGDLFEEPFMQNDHRSAVFVVKHDYQPKHERKYVGTEMEAENAAYPRKNWSSVILFDCGHQMNRCLTPEYLRKQTSQYLHRFSWLPDERIGTLGVEWNWLDEFGENQDAKILHYTNGIPGFTHYKNAPHAHEWRDAAREMNRGIY